jgi:hypothetical protein
MLKQARYIEEAAYIIMKRLQIRQGKMASKMQGK